MSIFTPKISDDFFNHRLWFSDFSFIFKDFPYLCCHVIYDPFFTRKPLFKKIIHWLHLFYSVRAFMLSRASVKHYFSKYWEDGCIGRPPPQSLGGPSPQTPSRSPPMISCIKLTIILTSIYNNLRSARLKVILILRTWDSDFNCNILHIT